GQGFIFDRFRDDLLAIDGFVGGIPTGAEGLAFWLDAGLDYNHSVGTEFGTFLSELGLNFLIRLRGDGWDIEDNFAQLLIGLCRLKPQDLNSGWLRRWMLCAGILCRVCADGGARANAASERCQQ